MKTKKLYQKGSISEQVILDSVPFTMPQGIPIVKVKIGGEVVNMLFDTGAPNVISPRLAKKMGLKKKVKLTVGDSGGNREHSEMVMIPEIELGHHSFLETAALVLDLNTDIFACMQLDGIIGANLMKLAKWHIDFDHKMLYFSSSLSAFPFVDEYARLVFETARTFTPKIDFSIDNQLVKNVTFDTGSNGNLRLSKKAWKAKIKNKSSYTERIFYGVASTGAHGKSKSDTLILINGTHLNLFDTLYPDFSFSYSAHKSLLGSKFLSNHDLVLDWENNTIYAKQISMINRNPSSPFGFALRLDKDKIVVTLLEIGRKASQLLKIGDEIINVNGTPVAEMEICNLRELVKTWSERSAINIVILRDGKEYYFNFDDTTDF